MLAHDYKHEKHDVDGWFVSEKLDGVRCFWDGGITTGNPIRDVPWANTGNKNRLVPRATGLWSRYGNVICAPDWFIESLPQGRLLDGELWLAHKCLEETRSIVSRHEPDGRWRAITYNLFDMPSHLEFCKSGVFNNPNFKSSMKEEDCFKYFGVKKSQLGCKTFAMTWPFLKRIKSKYTRVIPQTKMSSTKLDAKLEEIVANDGEGLVMRRPYSFWVPHRSHHLLRYKPSLDAEAVVIGYNAGLGKHKGRLGSLRVRWNEQVFDLGGFTDEERRVNDRTLFEREAGERILDPANDLVPEFPLGSTVTFKYNGLTNGGDPREARYWRKRNDI